MIDPKRCREDRDSVRKGLLKKGDFGAVFDAYLVKDKEWRQLLQDIDTLKQQRNKAVPKGKPTDGQRESLKALSDEIKERQELLASLEQEVRELALGLPNVPLEDVPLGEDEADNVEERVEGKIPSFDFKPQSHENLGHCLNILNAEQATKMTGSRFMVYHGKGAVLERALINFMLDLHVNEHGYQEVQPPVIVNSKSLMGTGQLPKFSDDLFKIEDSDYWLSSTAEVQLTNLYAGDVLSSMDLPCSVTAHTSCFRKEAGSYGKDMKGLIRLHQFNKVELVKIVSPEESEFELQNLLGHAEAVLRLLGLPYRVVSLCAGDLGFSSAKTYDLEVWLPSQGCYREISSCSNFLDFQSRRAMIRCKSKGINTYPHTLNGSGLAVGRTWAAILENFQCRDGSVDIPECLHKYTGFKKIC